MASTTERLLQLKNEIEQAKLDKASIEGALKQNMTRLKDEFRCRSIAAAETELEKLKDKKAALEEQIENAVEQLEASYDW